MGNLSKYEQETIINYNNEDKFATIYTADPTTMRKLDKLCEKFPDNYLLIESNSYSKTYKCQPKKLVSFRSPSTRVYTEEEKERMMQNLKNGKKNK